MNEVPYSEILTKKYNGKIWFTGDEFYEIMNSVCQDRKEHETTWDCFSKNKVNFSLTGRAISNNSVEIFERYFLNDKVHSINKVFEFENGSWSFKITGNELTE